MEDQTWSPEILPVDREARHVTVREPVENLITRLSDMYISRIEADDTGGNDDQRDETDLSDLMPLAEQISSCLQQTEALDKGLSQFIESTLNREELIRDAVRAQILELEEKLEKSIVQLERGVIDCLKRRGYLPTGRRKYKNV